MRTALSDVLRMYIYDVAPQITSFTSNLQLWPCADLKTSQTCRYSDPFEWGKSVASTLGLPCQKERSLMVGPSVPLRNYQILTHFVPLDLEGATNYLLDRQMAHSASFVGEGDTGYPLTASSQRSRDLTPPIQSK